MIKCEVIKEFTLEKFDELKNIQRRRIDTKGKLYIGDTFECDKEMADYLMGDNKNKQVVVKVIEVEPEKEEYKKEFMKEITSFENEIGDDINKFEKQIKQTVKNNLKKKKSSKK